MLRKLLVAIFAVIIISFGVVGYNEIQMEPNEVIDEEEPGHPAGIKL